MGAWGTGLFDDDVPNDVRAAFLDLLADASSPALATQSLLATWSGTIADPDDGTLFWLALAATQWEHGCLQPDVRSRALSVIDDGADLDRWDSRDKEQRRAVLNTLRNQLTSPQPRPRQPKRRIPVVVPSNVVVSPDGLAKATACQLLLPTGGEPGQMQVSVEMHVLGGWGGGGVFVADCRYDQVTLSWRDADSLEIEYPASATRLSRKDELFQAGRIVKITYRTSND